MEVVIPQNPALFKGYFPGLNIACKAAESFSNEATVLEPFPSPLIDEFRRHYRHHSPNPPWFEQWCFESWLLLAEWLHDNETPVAFKADSDCMIFSNLDRVYEEIGKPPCTMPHADSFITRKAAQAIADEILRVFRDKCEREVCAPGHVSDLQLLAKFLPTLGAKSIADWDLPAVIDTNLFKAPAEDAFEGHKDVWFTNGEPFWHRQCGRIRMLTLHCWGKAKNKMAAIWEQSQRSKNGELVRLTLNT